MVAPLLFLYSGQGYLVPPNVLWEVLSPRAVPSCQPKLPERCDRQKLHTIEKKKNSPGTDLQDSADTSRLPQSSPRYQIHNHNGPLPLWVNNNRGGL